VPGEYRIEVQPSGGNLLYLKEARFENADVLSSPMRFSGNSNSGFDVVVATGGGRIDGSLNDVRSQPLPGTRVVLVPARARYRPDLHKTTFTDQNGRFVFATVAPGDYKVFAWESLEDNAWFDPDVISRSETRGRSVHVTATSSETIDLRIIPAEGSR
jgi:hypothetical protein